MECLYCGYDFEGRSRCPACGTNALIMKKIYNTSAKLYNKGLEQALNNDFYNAAISLKNSIIFNKQNVEARNLLGLVYYRTGRLADAVKEWIISANFKNENNAALDYINVFQQNIRDFEKLNEAVKLYNHAITFLKQKNDDVAVIRLKKAIDVNPNFVEARNLLALCYLKKSKKNKVIELAEKTLEIDSCNPVALKFIREVNLSLGSNKKKKKKNRKQNSMKSFEPQINPRPRASFAAKLAFMLFGAVCSAVVMGVLIIPESYNMQNEKYNKLEQNYQQLEKTYTDYLGETKTKIEELESENQQMKSVVDEYKKTVEDSKKIENLSNARKLFDDGDSVEAAKVIAAVDITNADETLLNQYNELKETVYSSACEKLFEEGSTYFDNQDLDNAKNSFNMCITFGDNSPDLKYSSYYQLGKIALGQEENEAAKNYFTEVKNNHPSANMKGYADNYLKTLE